MSSSHPWTVFAASGEKYAWCTTFEDAVKHAAKAGEGATIEGPWMERLVLATPATAALAEVESALLAAVKRNDMPAVIALAHALTALRATPAAPTR